ncbi:hypothetical protein [Vibrio phage vB_VpaP_SJSY21]|nr:hypothetical protein [Vibrio phage vB_VpaP_SJSY21]
MKYLLYVLSGLYLFLVFYVTSGVSVYAAFVTNDIPVDISKWVAHLTGVTTGVFIVVIYTKNFYVEPFWRNYGKDSKV